MDAPANAEALRQNRAFLYHVSTAFVAGASEEVMTPDRLNLQVQFRNHYEASKAHAEAIVRSLSDRLAWCVLRPSVIVGDSLTGYTTAFNVIYIPAKYIAQGLLKCFPGLPTARLDVVPVDYVAEAVTAFALTDRAHTGETFHLCCGVGREPSLTEVIEALVQTVNDYWRQLRPDLAVPKFVPLDLISRASLSLTEAGIRHVRGVEGFLSRHMHNLKRIAPFVPYLGGNPQFDTTSTESRLAGLVTPAPVFTDYGRSLFKFCLDTNWGKKECSAASLMASGRYIIPGILPTVPLA
jgi:nucleoside-diphosphate-sugar epimerase